MLEKNSVNSQKWLNRYIATDSSTMLVYGIIDKREGKGYYTVIYDLHELVKWVAVDLDSEGNPALRIEPDSFLRAKVKSSGKQFDLNRLEGREGNRGERFESFIAETLNATYSRDNAPYHIAPDLIAFDNVGVSCKFERATLARLDTIEKALNTFGK